jgi:glycosyltransferase involved in cell wall biosynthesis
MKPIRIALIAPTPYLDGPGRVIEGILKHLDRRRFEPSFLSIIKRPESSGYPHIGNVLEDLDIPYLCLDMAKPLDLVSPARIFSYLHQQRVDLVHSHLLRGNLYGRIAARLAGLKRIVNTVHSTKQWMEAHPLLEGGAGMLDKLTVGLANRVVAVSDEVKDTIRKLPGYRNCHIMTIPNGIDPAPFACSAQDRAEGRRAMDVRDDRFVVGFVGRVDEQKNPLLMLDVMHRIFQERPDVILAVVGKGRMSDQVAARVRELGIAGQVRLMGHRRDIPRLLSGFDAFFMCSLWEGHPIALCEAMASGLPCVTTPVEGTRRMMRPGENGFVVGFDDSAGMEEALLSLIRARGRAAAMGQAARETIQKEYTEEKMSQAYQSLYLKLTEQVGAMV